MNNPANDYVRTFFRGVDISQVFSAKDISRRSPEGLIRKTPGVGPRSALQLLQDKDFLSRIEKSMTEIGNQNNLEAESEDNENLDMDEDMMLAGLSMFDSEI